MGSHDRYSRVVWIIYYVLRIGISLHSSCSIDGSVDVILWLMCRVRVPLTRSGDVSPVPISPRGGR